MWSGWNLRNYPGRFCSLALSVGTTKQLTYSEISEEGATGERWKEASSRGRGQPHVGGSTGELRTVWDDSGLWAWILWRGQFMSQKPLSTCTCVVPLHTSGKAWSKNLPPFQSLPWQRKETTTFCLWWVLCPSMNRLSWPGRFEHWLAILYCVSTFQSGKRKKVPAGKWQRGIQEDLGSKAEGHRPHPTAPEERMLCRHLYINKNPFTLFKLYS